VLNLKGLRQQNKYSHAITTCPYPILNQQQVLDARVHLPLFLSGLLETQDPHRFVAIQGALDLIKARGTQLYYTLHGGPPTMNQQSYMLCSPLVCVCPYFQACKDQLPTSLPHLLPPLKTALGAADPIVVATALKASLIYSSRHACVCPTERTKPPHHINPGPPCMLQLTHPSLHTRTHTYDP
jgi:hypothetical protein